MTKFQLAAIAAFGIALSGCAITSSARQDAGAGEGIWYVKLPYIGKAKVYYCPPQSTDCYQADVIDTAK